MQSMLYCLCMDLMALVRSAHCKHCLNYSNNNMCEQLYARRSYPAQFISLLGVKTGRGLGSAFARIDIVLYIHYTLLLHFTNESIRQ